MSSGSAQIVTRLILIMTATEMEDIVLLNHQMLTFVAMKSFRKISDNCVYGTCMVRIIQAVPGGIILELSTHNAIV